MPNYLLWARRNRLAINPVGVQDGYVAPNSVRVVQPPTPEVGPSPRQITQTVIAISPITVPTVALNRGPLSIPGGTVAFGAAFLRRALAPTLSIASPCVVSYTGHALANNSMVLFNTNGSLPTGVVSGAFYYVLDATANTFQLAPIPGGSALSTSGGQSGTHSLWYQV